MQILKAFWSKKIIKNEIQMSLIQPNIKKNSELIIHVRLMTLRYKIKQNKARAKYQCMIKEKNCGIVRVMQKRLLVLKHFRNICRLCRK